MHKEVSGRDAKSAAAVRWFGGQGRRVPVDTRDIEVKLAVYMREIIFSTQS
ncbi:hypothetical protein ACOBQX_17405 [Actinokineospora sp. G85]|uniref:hypothetical protein n=1 Tax=Actinokineospora sp. G85 TaxID=3406626 RepID=UPI003C77159F